MLWTKCQAEEGEPCTCEAPPLPWAPGEVEAAPEWAPPSPWAPEEGTVVLEVEVAVDLSQQAEKPTERELSLLSIYYYS